MTLKRPDLLWTQNPKEIGDFLRQVRIEAGMPQKHVAAMLLQTPSFIANVEAGRRLPSTPKLFQWFTLLDLHFMLKQVNQDGL